MPCGLYARYDTNGPAAKLIIGPVRIHLLKPRPTKSKDKKTKATKSNAKTKNSNNFSDFLPLLRLVLNFLSDFRKKLIIKKYYPYWAYIFNSY
jgi:hypothetical protein